MASFYPELYQTALTLRVEAREKAGFTQEALAARFGQSRRPSRATKTESGCWIWANSSRSLGPLASTRMNS